MGFLYNSFQKSTCTPLVRGQLMRKIPLHCSPKRAIRLRLKPGFSFPVPPYTSTSHGGDLGTNKHSDDNCPQGKRASVSAGSPQWNPLSSLVSPSLLSPTRLKTNHPVLCTTSVFKVSASTLPFLSQHLFKPDILMRFAIQAVSLSLYSAHRPPWGDEDQW